MQTFYKKNNLEVLSSIAKSSTELDIRKSHHSLFDNLYQYNTKFNQWIYEGGNIYSG